MNWHAVGNAVLFQVVWFAAVLWGTPAALAALAALVVQIAPRGTLRADATMGAILAAVGLGLDTAWIHLGILDFHGAAVAPLWIVLLWFAVGVTLNHSLAFLMHKPLLGALLVGPGGAVSYLAGEQLGGVIVPDSAHLVVVVVAWTALFAVVLGRVVPLVNASYAQSGEHAVRNESIASAPGASDKPLEHSTTSASSHQA